MLSSAELGGLDPGSQQPDAFTCSRMGGKRREEMYKMKHSIQTKGSFLLGMEMKAQSWTCHEERLEGELCSIYRKVCSCLKPAVRLVFKERHPEGLGSCTSHLAARGTYLRSPVLSDFPALQQQYGNGGNGFGVGAQALPHQEAGVGTLWLEERESPYQDRPDKQVPTSPGTSS